MVGIQVASCRMCVLDFCLTFLGAMKPIYCNLNLNVFDDLIMVDLVIKHHYFLKQMDAQSRGNTNCHQKKVIDCFI